MNNQPLVIKASCRNNSHCVFENKDMFIDISITNQSDSPVNFPLEFIRKTGPAVKLFEKDTKAEAYLKSNLADLALKARFTAIDPGKSVNLEWVITAGEIQQFGNKWTEVFAEFTVMTEIKTNDKLTKFVGIDVLRITSKK